MKTTDQPTDRRGSARQRTDTGSVVGPARLWTVEEVSAFLGVPVETLYRWRKVGTGPPAARIGRHLRYDPADVRAWVRARVT